MNKHKLLSFFGLMFVINTTLMSAVLFEVKNSNGKVIMEVADDGVRFFNPAAPITQPDTIMVISANNISANVSSELSRDFDITDAGSTRGRLKANKLLKVSNNAGTTAIDDSAMIWYKQKNAFRVGHVIITDENSVGQASFGSGSKTKATGEISTAMGNFTKATGTVSTAIGNNTMASGDYSIAMGYNSIASGYNSIAMGRNTQATETYATAFGTTTIASGPASTAMGQSSIASGIFSTAMGLYTNAQAKASTAIGAFNKIEGSPMEWVLNDPLFVIGNGFSENYRSNAFEVKKNGEVYIPNLSLTTSTNNKQAVMVDSQGMLCISNKSDNVPDPDEIHNLKAENIKLKTRIDEQNLRIEKLEKMIENIILNKRKSENE